MTITQDATSQSKMTPDQALAILKEGNQRFQENQRLERDLRAQVRATQSGQWPYAVVLSCIDSRAAPEIVLDVGIGDIFAIRLAGNVVDQAVLGSIEFACKVAGASLVLVLAHSHCGAVKGACDDVQLGNLTSLLARLKPAVEATSEPADAAQRTSANADFVLDVARKHVELTLDDLREQSPILKELEQAGTIRLVGAMYDIETGAVAFSS